MGYADIRKCEQSRRRFGGFDSNYEQSSVLVGC